MKSKNWILTLLFSMLLWTPCLARGADYNITLTNLAPESVDTDTSLLYKITTAAKWVYEAMEGKGTNKLQVTGALSATMSGLGDQSTNQIQAIIVHTNAVTFSSTNLVVASADVPAAIGGEVPLKSITFCGYKAPRTANTGTVYIQVQSANGTNAIPLPSGATVTWSAPTGMRATLSQFYIDVATADDGVTVIWSN